MEPSPLHGVVPAKAKPATVKTTSKIDKSAKKTVVRPTTTLEHGLFVNVGLFAVADNANKALKKLQDAGLDATKQEMSSKKGLMTRVSVGPFSSRATAETTVKQIHGLKLDAIIVQR
jgi:cell division septation protein DedD